MDIHINVYMSQKLVYFYISITLPIYRQTDRQINTQTYMLTQGGEREGGGILF